MIEFKVVSTIDKNQQQNYQHWTSEMVIGSLIGDLIIDDPNIGEQQLRIHIEGDRAILENLYPRNEIRVNGKAVSGTVELRPRDNLNVGKTSINFTRLDTRPPDLPEPFEHPNAEVRFLSGTKEKAILDALEYLSTSGNAPAASSPPIPPPPIPKFSGPPPFRK